MNYHVNLHISYDFREELELCIKEKYSDFSFTAYLRNVWENSGHKRIKTRGLVMEVDSKQTNEIVDQVLQIEFKGNFKDVTFNPFIRLQSIDHLVMTNVFKAQQEFLRNTTSTLVPGLNPTVQ